MIATQYHFVNSVVAEGFADALVKFGHGVQSQVWSKVNLHMMRRSPQWELPYLVIVDEEGCVSLHIKGDELESRKKSIRRKYSR